MIIFSENINTINNKVAAAIRNRDSLFFKRLINAQIKSSIVDVIDINAGSDSKNELNDMRWLVKVVQEVTKGQIPLSIDSSNPDVIKAGIQEISYKKGSFINSITLKEGRFEALLPVAKKYGLKLIALPIDESGVPDTAEKRLELSKEIVRLISMYDIDLKDLFIDCIVSPVSINVKNALISLKTLRLIKKELKKVNTFICVSAVSFGLPERKKINSEFLGLLIRDGIDAVILDPMDRMVKEKLFLSDLLLGTDENCTNFLGFVRGK